MKLFYCFLFGLFVKIQLYSQNCKRLESETFFESIKFGEQLPSDLTVCSKKANVNYCRLQYDSLNEHCKKIYSNFFTFLSIPFSYSDINTNKNGLIFQVNLYSFFNNNHREVSIIYSPPTNFVKLYSQLISLYGKPTRIEEATNRDSLFIKELGMPRIVIWECNYISLQLRVNYGSRNKALNMIAIQIKNRHFELLEQTESLE